METTTRNTDVGLLEELGPLPVVIFKSLCALVSVLGNFLVILAVITDSSVRRVPNNIFICSLAVSDFMIGAYVMPLDIFKVLSCFVEDSESSYKVPLRVVRWFFLRASTWSLCVISYDRYKYVEGVTRYKYFMVGSKVVQFALFGWMMGTVNTAWMVCSVMIAEEVGAWMHIINHAFEFGLSNLILLMCYHKIYRLTKQRMKGKAVASSRLVLRRTSLIIGILIVSFVLLYLPQCVTHVYYLISPDSEACPKIAASNWMVYFNSLVNPIVYALFNESFRAAIASIFTCKCWTSVPDPTESEDQTVSRSSPKRRSTFHSRSTAQSEIKYDLKKYNEENANCNQDNDIWMIKA